MGTTEPDNKQHTFESPYDLLFALNAVAIELQHSIQRKEDIYQVFQKQVVSLGLRGGISFLNHRGDTLCFKTIAYSNPLRKVLDRFEKSLNINAEGFEIPVDQVDVYRKVVREGRTEFVEDSSTVSLQVIPNQFRKAAASLMSFLGTPPGIFTPLVFNGEVKGMLNIVGPNLTEKDIPAVRAFSNQFSVAFENSQLVNELQSATQKLEIAYQATLIGWVQALDLRDQETEGHTLRTAEATVHLAEYLNVPEESLLHIHRGALLHDIGKMAIPDSILQKPGPLTNAEWDLMKEHPVIAYQWLSTIEFLRPALDIPYCHHERWDGSGYPRGLRKEEIPLSARLFTVVDVWDAMTSDRPYRKRISEKEVKKYLKSQAGVLFDEQVVKSFFKLMRMGKIIK